MTSTRQAIFSARAPAGAPPANIAARVRIAVDAHHDVVWRLLRRLGVAPAEIEDAVQKVFVVFAERLPAVEASAERGFLLGSAVRVAAEARRRGARWGAILVPDEGTAEIADPSPSAESVVDDRRLRRWLDEVLDTLPDDLRAVLVLVDIEEQTMAETAKTLGVPPGTVASRLRRARQVFEASAEVLRERLDGGAR